MRGKNLVVLFVCHFYLLTFVISNKKNNASGSPYGD